MAINVKLPEALVETAKRYGNIEHRSVPKQIEYWSQIGKIASENPDLPFSVIRDILIADQEEPSGEYQFGIRSFALRRGFESLRVRQSALPSDGHAENPLH